MTQWIIFSIDLYNTDELYLACTALQMLCFYVGLYVLADIFILCFIIRVKCAVPCSKTAFLIKAWIRLCSISSQAQQVEAWAASWKTWKPTDKRFSASCLWAFSCIQSLLAIKDFQLKGQATSLADQILWSLVRNPHLCFVTPLHFNLIEVERLIWSI